VNYKSSFFVRPGKFPFFWFLSVPEKNLPASLTFLLELQKHFGLLSEFQPIEKYSLHLAATGSTNFSI